MKKLKHNGSSFFLNDNEPVATLDSLPGGGFIFIHGCCECGCIHDVEATRVGDKWKIRFTRRDDLGATDFGYVPTRESLPHNRCNDEEVTE